MQIEGSRLVLPALPLEALPASRLGLWRFRRKALLSASCKELLSFYAEQRQLEERAPFAPLVHEYWIGKSDEDIAFIDLLDAKWVQALQPVRDFLRWAA